VTLPLGVFLGVYLGSAVFRRFILAADPGLMTAVQAWRAGGLSFLAHQMRNGKKIWMQKKKNRERRETGMATSTGIQLAQSIRQRAVQDLVWWATRRALSNTRSRRQRVSVMPGMKSDI
jgi:hypothetical protein